MYDPREHGTDVIWFGQWVVTSEGIAWGNGSGPSYFVAKDRLWETRPGSDRQIWDWLVHMTEKTWLSDMDIYQLNTAFFFAQDYHAKSRPQGAAQASNWKTLKAQQDELRH